MPVKTKLNCICLFTIIFSFSLSFCDITFAETISKSATFQPNTVIKSAEVNKNFDDLYNLVNGNLDNENVATAAGILQSKLQGPWYLNAADQNPKEALYVDENGYIGIGTKTPRSTIEIMTLGPNHSGQTTVKVRDMTIIGNYPAILFNGYKDGADTKRSITGHSFIFSQAVSSDYIYLGYAGSDTAGTVPTYATGWVVKTNGNMGVGTINPAQKLDVNGNIAVSGTTVYTSDARFKDQVKPIADALSKVAKLVGVSFKWRTTGVGDHKFEKGKQLGVIAQEVEKVLPELVVEDDEGYKSVKYPNLIPVLIEAIKEQSGVIEGQKSDIKELRDKLNRMEVLLNGISKKLN